MIKTNIRLLAFGLILVIFSACNQPKEQPKQKVITEEETIEKYRFPAEFEPHQAVWVGWSTYENKKGYSTRDLHLNIIKELMPFVNVKIAVQDSTEIMKVKELLVEKDIAEKNISFMIVPHADIWFRDMGPNFLVSPGMKHKIADFNFNVWGYETPDTKGAVIEEKVDEKIAKLLNLEIVSTNVISEGGNREFDGKGTMITTESVELQRNPQMTKSELETEYKRVLGVEKIIWLKRGLYEDDFTFDGLLPGPDDKKSAYTVITTGGHIDEFCRIVAPNKILLAEVSDEKADKDPIAKENKKRLDENYEILKNSTDVNGKPFEIIRIPLPETIYDTLSPGDGVYDYIADLEYKDGSVFPKGEKVTVIPAASYLNFLITNGVVLAQKYWKPGLPESIKERDNEAQTILQKVFPKRKIIMLDAMAANIGGGGIHCITQQEPVLSK